MTAFVHKALFYTAMLLMLATNANAEASAEQIHHSEKEEIQTIVKPKEIDVDPLSTYNGQFMTLMSSKCRPETDGFFGSTSGDKVHIQYGFKVEVQPLSAIMDILDAIEEKVVDSVLQSSFPAMCGLHQGRKTQESSEKSMLRAESSNRSLAHEHGHPSGFRFLEFEEVEKCTPQESEVNFCGIFTGALYVYGKHQHGKEASRDILSTIDEVLDTSEPSDLHSELTLLSSANQFSAIDGDSTDSMDVSSNVPSNDSITESTTSSLSRLGTLLLIVGIMVAVAIGYYMYIQRKERRYYNSESEGSGSGEDKFVDDDLRLEPYRDDRKNSGFYFK